MFHSAVDKNQSSGGIPPWSSPPRPFLLLSTRVLFCPAEHRNSDPQTLGCRWLIFAMRWQGSRRPLMRRRQCSKSPESRPEARNPKPPRSHPSISPAMSPRRHAPQIQSPESRKPALGRRMRQKRRPGYMGCSWMCRGRTLPGNWRLLAPLLRGESS